MGLVSVLGEQPDKSTTIRKSERILHIRILINIPFRHILMLSKVSNFTCINNNTLIWKNQYGSPYLPPEEPGIQAYLADELQQITGYFFFTGIQISPNTLL